MKKNTIRIPIYLIGFLIPFCGIFPERFVDNSKLSYAQFTQIYDEILASESKSWAAIEFSCPMSIIEMLKLIKAKNSPLIKIDSVGGDNISFQAPAGILLPLLKEIDQMQQIRISRVSFTDRPDDIDSRNSRLVESFKISEAALTSLIAKTTEPNEKARLILQLEETKRSRIWLTEDSLPKGRVLRATYYVNSPVIKK
jgi:hypothetical protein